MRTVNFLIAATMAIVLLAINPAKAGHGPEPKVEVEDLKLGSGERALPFSTVEVHYTGWLEDGTQFDSSLERGTPFKFTLNAGDVIPGWDKGVRGMQVGGKRVLQIPPELAYGARGAGNVIPANASLRFEIELLSATRPPFTNIDNQTLAEKLAGGVTLIDIRREDEWRETGIVQGSVTLTAFDERGRFQRSFLTELENIVARKDEFVLICRSGNRTAVLTNWLSTEGGYKNVANVQEGIKHWIAMDRPVIAWP